MDTNKKVALVTGGTSGIGEAVAKKLRSQGHIVYTLSRRRLQDPMHIAADTTDEEACIRAVEKILDAQGRLDILVNCAGMGISGALEFTPRKEAVRQLDVNLMGMANGCKAVIGAMREAGGGRIVNVSSVAGVIPIPFQAWYSATKAAMNAYTMALDNEVRRFGIEVCAVMPGDTRTGFTAARRKEIAGDDLYQGAIERSVQRMEHDEQSGDPPEKAAALICKAALRRHVKPLYAAGLQYKVFSIIIRVLPCRISNWMLRQLYAK